jgi:hypothetical protein
MTVLLPSVEASASSAWTASTSMKCWIGNSH